MKKLIYYTGLTLILVIGIILIVNRVAQKSAETHSKHSIFSWSDEVVLAEERPALLSILDRMDIGAIYQSFSKELLASQEAESFLSQMQEHTIDVFYLTGEAEWGLEADGASLKEEIMKVELLNQKVDKKAGLKGLVIDVEPYLLEEWDAADKKGKVKIIETFIDGLEAAYQVAKDKDLIMIVTIPNFYDRYSLYELDRLISLAGDGIAVMNYDRTDEFTQIENEVHFSKKHGKPIINIAELQQPGKHKLVDINTYYNVGLEELQKSWASLDDRFQYPKLSFSYHYYDTLKELLE
ncbi:hypothetical protein PAT3040_00123 [Paenibacillus agaridevorans]|uniref:GH18 domain-containing protein n=1 Tax=Paenibacillus agaridevorans TaxID=171404 RepID=A0A2R5EJ42_9BACL|nr:hypothetical protein [Paenibacillus agaridevorans]GBG05639.1 hypothetical protein PAT3040_00123 [Paenibacillus agaridevorans]